MVGAVLPYLALPCPPTAFVRRWFVRLHHVTPFSVVVTAVGCFFLFPCFLRGVHGACWHACRRSARWLLLLPDAGFATRPFAVSWGTPSRNVLRGCHVDSLSWFGC